MPYASGQIIGAREDGTVAELNGRQRIFEGTVEILSDCRDI